MLVETTIDMSFCAVGAILNVRHSEDVLHLRRKIGHYISFLPTCYPDGVNHKAKGYAVAKLRERCPAQHRQSG